MIFGFGRKNVEEEDDEEGEEVEYVQFQGALNGKEANLNAHARLVQAGLMLTKALVTDAVMRRAELLRIESKGDRAVVQLSIDGVPYTGDRLSKQQALAVTQMLKLLAGLDVQERQKPQSGGIRAEVEGTKYELRVNTAPVAGGAERAVVKIRNIAHAPTKAEDVGFTPEIKLKIRDLAGQTKGAILVCGAPNSGVSTTTFAVLRSVDAYQYTVYTIGDRQGWELPNVTAFDVNEGESLETTLDRAIRSEADVIYLDPLRDVQTAALVVKFAPKVVFVAEFPAPDAAHGIVQLAKLVGSGKAAADGLHAAVSQRLIRTLCNDCKLAYRPNPKIVARIGLPPETKTLYRPAPPPAPNPERPEEEVEPCATCGGAGYVGRTAMFEIIEMTDPMKKLVASGAGAPEIKALARQEQMRTLQQEGLKLVVAGRTSLEELQRVFQPKK